MVYLCWDCSRSLISATYDADKRRFSGAGGAEAHLITDESEKGGRDISRLAVAGLVEVARLRARFTFGLGLAVRPRWLVRRICGPVNSRQGPAGRREGRRTPGADQVVETLYSCRQRAVFRDDGRSFVYEGSAMRGSGTGGRALPMNLKPG